MQLWNVLHGLAANTGHKKSSKNRHLGTIALLYRAISLQLRHISTIGKKLVKQEYLLHMFPQYGKLAAQIGPVVWGTPANFNGFRILAALLHGTPVLGVSQTLRRWREGATTYIRQGGITLGIGPHSSFILCYNAMVEVGTGWSGWSGAQPDGRYVCLC